MLALLVCFHSFPPPPKTDAPEVARAKYKAAAKQFAKSARSAYSLSGLNINALSSPIDDAIAELQRLAAAVPACPPGEDKDEDARLRRTMEGLLTAYERHAKLIRYREKFSRSWSMAEWMPHLEELHMSGLGIGSLTDRINWWYY